MYPHQEGFENWCRGPQRLSPKSIENADYCLDHFFSYAEVNFPSRNVNEITASNVRDYLQQLATKKTCRSRPTTSMSPTSKSTSTISPWLESPQPTGSWT